MTLPKLAPCPTCDTDEWLAIYTYENGGRHVECDRCYYLGPGEGSQLQAVRSHNELVRDRGRAVPDHGSGPTIMHPEGYST